MNHLEKRTKKNYLSGLTLLALSFVCSATFSQSVDMLTGRLQMSVPIGSLNANDITVPISIYHKGTNVKVAEGEGDLAVGWSLSAGGAVSRVVRGLPDEINTATKKGWLYNSNAANVQSFSPIANDDLSICTDEAADWNFLENLIGPNYQNDTEPDIFFINAPGLSAKFVFGADGLPKLLTYQDIQITADLTNSVTPFIVKTNNGYIYTFNDGGSSVTRSSSNRKGNVGPHAEYSYYKSTDYSKFDFVRVWNLSSMSSVKTGTAANFGYSAFEISGASRQYNSSDSLYLITDVYTQSKLKTITLKSSKATINWDNDRLNSIEIEETNLAQKQTITFGYSQLFPNLPNLRSKSFLTEINISSTCDFPKERKYSFEYEGFPLAAPLPYSDINRNKNWGQDYFGYPNGVASNKNLPTLYFFATDTDGKRLRMQPFGTIYQTIAGQDRSVAGTISFGALKKIKLPTGGYSEITYSQNRYFDGSTAVERDGPGMRVSKIITQGGELIYGKELKVTSPYREIVKEYEYLNSTGTGTSGLLTYPSTLGYITSDSIRQSVNNIGEEPMVMYARVKEKVQGRGYTVFEYFLAGMFPETFIPDTFNSGEWKATKSRIARKPGPTCLPAGNLKTGYYLYPYPASTNYDFRRGTLSKVSVYAENNSLVREQTNTYTTLTKNPLTLKGIRFEKVKDIYLYGVYEMLTGRVDAISQEVVKEASQEDPTKLLQTTTTYAYNGNNFLQGVTTALPNGTTKVKSLKYANDFSISTPLANDTAAVALKALNGAYRTSELVEEIDYLTLPGQTQTVTNASLVIYRDFGNGRVLPYYLRWLPPGAAFTPASATAQNFIPDTDYVTKTTLKEYDAEGRVLTQFDDKRNYAATHYFNDLSAPAANFANAAARQAVFEGFEMTTSFGLTTIGTAFGYAIGWTGQKAISLQDNGTYLKLVSSSNINELIVKNGNKYRISCWAYGFQNANITFSGKSGATTVSTVLTVPTANKWVYLEGELNTSTLAATFQLEVSANASAAQPILLDDILCMPATARVNLQTVLPLRGVTSSTDDLGNSTKTTYDPMGRVVNQLDRNRNVVSRNEYALKDRQNNYPRAAFDSNVTVYVVNSPIVFTALDNYCQSGITYAWEVDGVGQANGPANSFTYTFATPGTHSVKLVTTNSLGLSSESPLHFFCVEFVYSGSLAISVTDGNGNPASGTLDCNTPMRILSVETGSMPAGCVFKIGWTRNGVGFPTNGGQVVLTGSAVSSTTYVEFQAWVYQDCTNFNSCTTTEAAAFVGSVSTTIVYVPSTCN
jgi:YD repeat-containing protein